MDNLNAHIVGKGKPLILLHGAPGSLDDWKFIIPFLSDKFEVHAIDRPGYGGSLAVPSGNLEKNILAISEYIKKHKLQNIIVVGHSYGGSVAARLVNSHYVNKVFVINAPLSGYKGAKAFSPFQEYLLKNIKLIPPDNVLKLIMKTSLKNHFKGTTTENKNFLEDLASIATKSYTTLRQELLNLHNDLNKNPIENYNFNIILSKDDDELFKLQAQESIKKGAKLFSAPGLHYPHIEQPKVVAEILLTKTP
ncbi:MAG: alpha/beta hydrolase [Bdellovibrionales bacterium]|nr:alpha/beta hydrolase [Bdellovibrionales bacterium]